MKTFLLSAAYLLIVIAIICAIDIFFYFIFDNYLSQALYWFNDQRWYIELLILIIGALFIFTLIVELLGVFAGRIGSGIFSQFPQNWFTLTSTLMVSVANAIYCISILWKVPENYSFWVIIELSFLSVLIWALSALVFPGNRKKESSNTF